LLPLGLLALTLVLAVRSVRSFGFWFGGALLIASTLTILVAILMEPILPTLLFGSVDSLAAIDVPGAVVAGLIRVILAALLEEWRARVLLQSGLGFIAGLFFVGIGLVALLVTMLTNRQPSKRLN
jgi:hypothetical protein